MGLFSKIFHAVTAPFRGIFHRERPSNLDELRDLEEQAEEEQPIEPEEIQEPSDLEEIPDNFEDAWEPDDYFVDEMDSFLMWDGHIQPMYEDMIDTMVSNGYISSFSSEEAEKEFLRFLGSDFWESKKQYIYTSELMAQVQDAIENGAKVSDLTQAFYEYESWQDEEADWEEFWNDWLQMEEF
jgi:hypothetical protein